MLAPGSVLPLLVEKPVAGGRMLARHEGQVVLVSGAIPGERVLVEIERVERGVAYAAARAVVEADPDRREAGADPRCGGHVYGHIRYERQLAIKAAVVEDAFARIARLESRLARMAASPERGYRMRARLHVSDGRAGFFREGTHELCDAGATGQLLPESMAAVEGVLAAWPAGEFGRIVAIELSENIAATERALHVELAADGRRRARAGAAEDAFAGEARRLGINGISAFAPASRSWWTICGDPRVTESLGAVGAFASPAHETAALTRHAHAFFQGNRFLLAPLVRAVLAQLPPDAGDGDVVDLYAGVGLFALALAAAGWRRVVAVEGDRTSAADLAANAAAFAGSIEVVGAPVEEMLASSRTASPAAVVVDPPRTGMSRDALNGVVRLRAERIVYVSCDVATLARDAGRLGEAGYQVAHMEGFDLFPNTAHVETVVRFDRTP